MKTLKEKKEELKNTMEMLEKGVKEVFTSDKFTEYLNTMSKFHNYSIKNILWLQMQNPNASQIGGMKTWNKLGRKVNKGEKSLRVLAPYRHKKVMEIDKLKYIDQDGKPIREKQPIEWISYRAVPVFDIKQTNGKDLPTLISELAGDVNNYDHMESSLIEVAKIPVEFENIKNGSKGYYHLAEKRIAINEGMSQQQTIKTMVHEITHSRLHSEDIQKEVKDTIERNTMEVEAESVAFVVSKHFGIDTDDYSFGYVAVWSKDKNLKQLESSLKTIQKEADSLIFKIEEKLEGKLIKDKAKGINITDENIDKYETFETTKEINLKDGTYIIKGTEFREEGLENGKYNLHFCEELRNKYTNETAEYEFPLSELKIFCVPTNRAVDKEKEDRKNSIQYLNMKTPYVEIVFSEVEDKKYFSEGEKIPFEEANKRFKDAEKEIRDKKLTAKDNKEYYPYLKTKFILVIEKDTKIIMRYDIGDNSSGDLKEFCGKQLDKVDLKLLNKSFVKSKKEQPEIEMEM